MKLPIWAYAAIAIVLLGGLGGAVTYIRHEGYRDGEAAATARCAEQQAKLARENQNAINAANKQLVERADELVLKELQLDDYVKANDLLAAAEPGADVLCLPAGSVRRVNSVR